MREQDTVADTASQNPHLLFRNNPTPEGCLKIARAVLRYYLKEGMGGNEGKTRCYDFLILINRKTPLKMDLKIIALGAFLNEDVSTRVKGKTLANLIKDNLKPKLVRYLTQDAIPKAMDVLGIADKIQLAKVQTIILERANKGEYKSLGIVDELNILPAQIDLSGSKEITQSIRPK